MSSGLNNSPVVRCGATIVAANVPILKEMVKDALAVEASSLTIDCEELEQIDSVGIGLLVQAHNTLAKRGGVLRLSNTPEEVAQLLRSMRLDKHFQINT